jgi:branched-chain amino acid transport system substrate-binding protein
VGHLGTAQNLAAMPIQFEKNVINFARSRRRAKCTNPFTGSSTPLPPPITTRCACLPRLAKEKAAKVCTMYQDDDFGLEVMRGAEAGLKTIGMELAEKTTYKRGATDFSSQVARMKAAGCDLVVLGTIIRETIGTIAEARKTGFNPTFLGSSASTPT